jgi:DNA processing protein
MAALAGYVLVVEAAERSGSLITARLAQKLGRDVGAVPGQVGIRVAAGSNALLRDGAHLVTCAADVLDRLAGVGSTTVGRLRAGPPLDDELRAALELVEAGATTADELALALRTEPRTAAVALARLELLGYLAADSSGACGRTTLAPPASPSRSETRP